MKLLDNMKRGLVTSVALWIVIFIEASILIFVFKLGRETALYAVIHYILLIIFVILAGIYYYKPRKVKPDLSEGWFLGLLFLITVIILDAIITIPFFIGGDYSFLIRPDIVIGYFIILFASGLFGMIKGKGKVV